jgi:hypothetical protein
MNGKKDGERIYKSVSAMIAGLRAGEIRAAAELGDVVHAAIKNEKLADEVLTIVFSLLPVKARRKMLNDPSVPSAKIIRLFPPKE